MRGSRESGLRGVLAAAFVVAMVLFVLSSFCRVPTEELHVVTLASDGMAPTLRDGERLSIDASRTPERSAIVAFRAPNDPDSVFVSRIVGLPGERVQLRDGRLAINDRAMPEPYLEETPPVDSAQILVGLHDYYVLGDNRVSSFDSRHFGTVPKELILGVVAHP